MALPSPGARRRGFLALGADQDIHSRIVVHDVHWRQWLFRPSVSLDSLPLTANARAALLAMRHRLRWPSLPGTSVRPSEQSEIALPRSSSHGRRHSIYLRP